MACSTRSARLLGNAGVVIAALGSLLLHLRLAAHRLGQQELDLAAQSAACASPQGAIVHSRERCPPPALAQQQEGDVHVDDGRRDEANLLAFVGVQTGPDSYDRRSALRAAWFPSDERALQVSHTS